MEFYHLIMSQWDKSLIISLFKISDEENNKYIILIATNAYDMGIDKSDITLVIQ